MRLWANLSVNKINPKLSNHGTMIEKFTQNTNHLGLFWISLIALFVCLFVCLFVLIYTSDSRLNFRFVPRSTNAQWRFFSRKSLTFGLGQTIWYFWTICQQTFWFCESLPYRVIHYSTIIPTKIKSLYAHPKYSFLNLEIQRSQYIRPKVTHST